jgi:dTDP-4-dehydrorhamnose reductase
MSTTGPCGSWVVLGGTGQLGAALAARLRDLGRLLALPSRAELDLSVPTRIASLLPALRPYVVIIAAAFTDVVRAELPDCRAEAFLLNRDVPAALAEACRGMSVPFVHVSTDYVFDGASRRPYREEDPVHPLQVYGASKLAGETEVLLAGGRSLVVRTSTLFGPAPRTRRNYVDAILEQARRGARIEVVELPVASPTFAPDLASGIIALVERGATGVVHVTNRGHCSRLELARTVVEEAGLGDSVEVRTREAVPGVPRPDYSVLDTARFEALTGTPLRPFRQAVAAQIRARTP